MEEDEHSTVFVQARGCGTGIRTPAVGMDRECCRGEEGRAKPQHHIQNCN